MKICNLASGSTGNCTYIETSKYKILIDLGKNRKYIINKLAEIGVNYEQIDYVFLTHTHDDHTSALKTFLKNHKATLVITQKMFLELDSLENLNKILIYEDDINIPDLEIKSFQVSHDTSDARGFVISDMGSSIVYITDTGYIKNKYLSELSNKTAYFIESNHDIEMLTHGPYPEWLKRRVLSDEGHLSNKFSGIYLSKMIGENTKNIVLLHLSEKNNSETCALETVKSALGNTNIKIACAKPNEVSEVFNL